jgi:NTE family protein
MRLDDRLLVDGGISDNLPVEAARSLGADYVIGVDVCRPARRGSGPFGIGMTALEIMVRRSGTGISAADCLISPDLAGASYARFRHRRTLIREGERAARDKLDQIRSDLGMPH